MIMLKPQSNFISLRSDGDNKVATESNEKGVGSIVARSKNAWACSHEMDFFLTGQFNVTIKTHDLKVRFHWRLSITKRL